MSNFSFLHASEWQSYYCCFGLSRFRMGSDSFLILCLTIRCVDTWGTCILNKFILTRNSYWTAQRIFLSRIFSIKWSTVFLKFYILSIIFFGVIFAQLYLQSVGLLLWDTLFLGFKNLFLWQFRFSLLFWGFNALPKLLEGGIDTASFMQTAQNL